MSVADPSITAYLIDPGAATIRAVAIERRHFFRTVRRLIGCARAATTRLDAAHLAYFDGDGLLEPMTGLWTFATRASRPMIAGRAAIVGRHGEAAPLLPLRTFAAMITAYRPVIIPDAAILTGRAAPDGARPPHFTARRLGVEGFRLGIERRRPLTVDAACDHVA
jgi:hypothetical protein